MKTVCTPKESQPAEKAVHPSSGVISEVLPRVNLGLRHAGSAKSTLGSASEMTPDRGVPFPLLIWIHWEARGAHRFHRKSPKMAQNHLKRGKTPLFARFSNVTK